MKNELVNMFGENYKERMLEYRIAEFVEDDETKKVFEELCGVVSNSEMDEEQIVGKLMLLPYNIAYCVIAKSSKYSTKMLNLYHDKLFEEFLRDVQKVDKKGVSVFDKRFNRIIKNYHKRYLNKRLLTRYELEVLFERISKLNGVKDLTYKEKREYNGENLFLTKLSSAHAVLTEAGQSRVRNKIIQEIKISLICDAIDNFKTLNQEL